jgi:hypothetical protein
MSKDLDQDRGPDRADELAPVDQTVAAALLELDLDVAPRHSNLAEPSTSLAVHRQELAATKRENRSTLNEIAASLGVSRFVASKMLEEPVLRVAGKRSREQGENGMRHDHGVGRRRHAGAGGSRGGLVRR